MNKIKNVFLLLILGVVIMYSCDDDNRGFINPYADVNYEELAVSQNDSILKFLKSHYYLSNIDPKLDSLKLITNGEISIFDDTNVLNKITVRENKIDHILYTYVPKKERPDEGGNPTEVDSVFVNRVGIRLLNNDLEREPFDSAEQTWWSLAPTFGLFSSAPSPIKGWVKGFSSFKSGKNITNNGPIDYENTGRGYIFIPSGLAYPSSNYQLGGDPTEFPYDWILIFKVELLDFVKNTDHDNDGVPSIEEDPNDDQDPTNDFSDATKPTIPDYLNPNIK